MDEINNKYTIERVIRSNRILTTIWRDETPIGSILLDPEEDKIFLESIPEFINATNDKYQQSERKRSRVDGDISKIKRDGGMVEEE